MRFTSPTYPKDKSDHIPGYLRVPLGKLCMNEQAKTSAQMMLCDDWNRRSVEKPGSGSSLLENYVHMVWLFFCDSSYSGAAWPMHSFSWRQACSTPKPFSFLQDLKNDGYGWIRPGLLSKKHIRETQCYTTGHRCSKFFCCNLKQAAHFWDGVQDSVLPAISREKKGKALVFSCNNRSTKPRDVWFCRMGRVGKTLGFTLYAGTVHSTIVIEQVHVWKHWWGNMIRKHWHVFKKSDM